MVRTISITILSLLFTFADALAQPSLTFDLKKPPKFENKTLASEKTGNKKFTVPRRFMQNTVTHYNFYFNANNRLNEIITRAKEANRDDYSRLLPFYNYSLQTTAGYKSDLDSVIYKATAGILIHDLRNDWVDNLYLLIGKAYYLRNQLDSAYLTFQYINYTFSPKEKDGYDKVIGSNAETGGSAFSISTREKTGVLTKAFSEPPSRNESLIWQVKTYLANNDLAEAGGLIETLKTDPAFPKRLNAELEEVQANRFYIQQAYDSAAYHLEKALDNAENKQERARWEYLIGQLYELTGKHDLAEKFFNKTISHTLNPVLEVYARLNAIRQDLTNEKAVNEAIEDLVKMARKDRYLSYRDIIYYTAATIELERKNPEGAIMLLQRSVKSSIDNPVQKSRSFIYMGDISFDLKKYGDAKSYYDSVNVPLLQLTDEKAFVTRKTALERIVYEASIVERQDSLQRVAAMPEKEREVFIKSLVKQLRKTQGVREDDSRILDKGNLGGPGGAPDLFGSSSKGDWYFANAGQKSKGATDFKAKWGTRPNADNWRRQAAISRSSQPQLQIAGNGAKAATPYVPLELTYDAFLEKLPLTPEKQKVSLDSTENALFSLGKAYMDGLEDYPSAITAFEKLLNTFPATGHMEETLFNLSYCYSKTGNPGNQAKMKQLLTSKYPGGKFGSLMKITSLAQSPDSLLKTKATQLYEKIYDLFIEGQFKDALVMKKQADSVYGENYWTPQLLYIEGVYFIRQREDSTARTILGKILQLFPSSPMFSKTNNLLAVLSRRKEIEDYLTNLKLEMPGEETNNRPVMAQGAVMSKEDQQKKLDAEKAAKELLVKKQQKEQAAQELKSKKDQAELAAKELIAQRESADRTAKELAAKIEQAQNAAKELQAKREQAALAQKDSLQKKSQEAEIAARELQQKKEREEIAARELQQKQQQEEIAARQLKQKEQEEEIGRREAEQKKQQEEITARELKQKQQQEEIARREAEQKKQQDEIATAELKHKKEREDAAAKELAERQKQDALAADALIKQQQEADELAARLAAQQKKRVAPPLVDTPKARPSVVTAPPKKTDTVQAVSKAKVANANYTDNAAESHYVAIVLDKVDPVYVAEARNAFNRYNRERYNGKPIDTSPYTLSDDTKLVVMSGFPDAAAALDYVEKTRLVSQTEIVPWLNAQKYSFILISSSNLEVLKTKKNVPAYKLFLKQLYPTKF